MTEGLREQNKIAIHPAATLLQDRVAAFEEQVLAWFEQARPGVPVLVLLDAPTTKAGLCISCGTPIGHGWRCTPCLEAVHRVIAELAL